MRWVRVPRKETSALFYYYMGTGNPEKEEKLDAFITRDAGACESADT